jgi:hypothetical protein
LIFYERYPCTIYDGQGHIITVLSAQEQEQIRTAWEIKRHASGAYGAYRRNKRGEMVREPE